MSYYYPGQSQNAPTTSTLAAPSPSNLDISCIIDPVAGKGGLYVGNITAATNNELLMMNGIRAMLTSAMQANFTPDNNVTPNYLKLPALDYPAFSLEPYFEQAADFINLNMSLTNVLVHCMAGVSRSVSFVIAYLLKYRKMTFEDTLTLMRSRRSISNPNEGFVEQLKKYEEYLKKESKAEQKKRKKMEKMLKNHHPALNQMYSLQNEQNQQMHSQKNLKKSTVSGQKEKSQAKPDRSKAQQPSILRSSQISNSGALKSSNSLRRLPSQHELYALQTKPKQNIPNSPQQPSRQSAPLQQVPSQNQGPKTNQFSTQSQGQSQIQGSSFLQQKSQASTPSTQTLASTQQQQPQKMPQQQYQSQNNSQSRPQTPNQPQAQTQYGIQSSPSLYNMYNPYNLYNQTNMYTSQNQMMLQNQQMGGQMNPYTAQTQFQQNQYSPQQMQYNQMLAQQQLSTSFGTMVDSRMADPTQKLKSKQDVQSNRRNNTQQQNVMNYGQNVTNYPMYRGGYGFY